MAELLLPVQRASKLSAVLRWDGLPFLLVTFVALGLRLWQLDGRAMHYDESLHVFYSYRLANDFDYEHQPWMHGPFQVHINALFFNLFGTSDYTARLGYALAGAALVFLPFFLRRYLGWTASLIISVMLTVSPALLYFSRFARNDIYMALWAMGLFVVTWRYLMEGKNRYLYIASALLALAFSTKETAYIVVAILTTGLFILSFTDLIPWIFGRVRLSDFRGPAAMLILVISLTLPQWSALSSLFQDIIGVVMASTNEKLGPVGLPVGNGWFATLAVLAVTLGLSFYVGVSWKWRAWLISAGIFYGIWLLLYTTAFSRLAWLFTGNWDEIDVGWGITGLWQGLGYWLAQQGVQRGAQPWYYYFVITPIYELVPLLFSFAAAFYYVWKRELLGIALLFWATLTFVAYSLAGEKMPWLSSNIALPLIVLGGKLVGDLVAHVQWRHVLKGLAASTMVVVPIALFTGMWLLLRYVGSVKLAGWQTWMLIAVFAVTALVWLVSIKAARPRTWLMTTSLGVWAFLLGYGAFSGFRAAYTFNDRPIEMLVYSQGSADVRSVARRIHNNLLEHTQNPSSPLLAVDYELWFPAQWYFRDDNRVEFRCYKDKTEHAWIPGCGPIQEKPSTQALLLIPSHASRDAKNLADFRREGEYRNLLWFPEVYRGVTPDTLKKGLASKANWRKALDYLVFRRIGSDWLHSEFFFYQAQQG